MLQAVAGHSPGLQLEGSTDNLAQIMSEEGLARMRDYLASHPPQTVTQRRRIVAAFLDKYALEDAIEVELDLPGWDEEYVEGLTQLYEHDMVKLARIPGVTVIAP